MPVDYQWYRSYVAHKYYDWTQKKECVVPPGLVVEARDATGARVGAGTSLDLGGPVYVLHERTKAKSKDVHYAFATPSNTLVDLTVATPAAGSKTTSDTRIVTQAALSADPKVRRSRYLLPEAWHSLGHEAQNGTAARQTYKAIQTAPPDLTKGRRSRSTSTIRSSSKGRRESRSPRIRASRSSTTTRGSATPTPTTRPSGNRR